MQIHTIAQTNTKTSRQEKEDKTHIYLPVYHTNVYVNLNILKK